MIPSNRGGQPPRRVLIVATIALTGLLAGCGIGSGAQTQSWHQPTDGSTALSETKTISISNAFVLGGPLDAPLAEGQNAGLFLAIYNSGPADRLLSITARGTASNVRLPGGSIGIGSQKVVLLTGPRPAVVLTDLIKPLAGGSAVAITLTFANAGQVNMTVPVMPRAQYYQTFSPAPSTVPSASASPSGSLSAKSRAAKTRARSHPSPGASASPATAG